MSFGGPNPQGALFKQPPIYGSFPLDRSHECSCLAKLYIACIKMHGHSSSDEKCRELTRKYLQCRMDHGLMESQEMSMLGLESSKQNESFNKTKATD